MRAYYHAHTGKYGSGGPVEMHCAFCGAAFQTTKRQANGHERKFCSRICKDKARQADRAAMPPRERYLFDKNKNLSRYGISLVEYNELYNSQQGRCVVCGAAHEVLHVDHDHETSAIRGLLCNTCNRFIGLAKESSEVLRAAADYLDGASP